MRRAVILLVAALVCLFANAGSASALPKIKHVWIVVLENKDYDVTFGPNSPAPYLAKTLPSQGQLLTHYYGIAHFSLPNYIAMVSGQPPNIVTQSDCQTFQEFVGTIRSDGVAVGQGCVYPSGVKTIADQLEAKGLRWKGYMEDQAASPTEPKTCRHPELNQQDHTQHATPTDQYAARHNPFVYFHSIIDRPICDANVLGLAALPKDLKSASTTPEYSFITPDLCSDGHDEPCVDGRPGGLKSIDTFLKTWIPPILRSPAYKDGGLVIVTFDEAEDDASDCCHEPMGPNTPNNGGLTQGNGGGRVGAVLLSPFIKPGSVNDTPYNHYSLLRSTEDMFGLPHLANAAQVGLNPFAEDVFDNPGGGGGTNGGGGPSGQGPGISLSGVPRGCVQDEFTARVAVTTSSLSRVNVIVDRRRIATRRTKRFKLAVEADHLRDGKHLLTVTARDKSGRSTSKSAAFRVC
jgi:phosphatidylinositol-3-phosphatase